MCSGVGSTGDPTHLSEGDIGPSPLYVEAAGVSRIVRVGGPVHKVTGKQATHTHTPTHTQACAHTHKHTHTHTHKHTACRCGALITNARCKFMKGTKLHYDFTK